jgi:hypothetical protein
MTPETRSNLIVAAMLAAMLVTAGLRWLAAG